MLFCPADRERCNYWHRDWRDRLAHIDRAEFIARAKDVTMFNSYTCALYPDSSLWVVPGSHKREDTPEEAALMGHKYMHWEEWDRLCYENVGGEEGVVSGQLARYLDAYVRSMPGAHQIQLEPGDFLLWSSALLHLGSYAPRPIGPRSMTALPATSTWPG